MARSFQKNVELCENVINNPLRESVEKGRLPRLPIEVLDLIGQDDTRDLVAGRDHHFKGITLDLIGNGADDAETDATDRPGIELARRGGQFCGSFFPAMI